MVTSTTDGIARNPIITKNITLDDILVIVCNVTILSLKSLFYAIDNVSKVQFEWSP